MPGADILLRSDIVVDYFEEQMRLLTDNGNKLLKRSFIEF